MRILFVSSCQEPGHDGVGDYIRLLAEACARLGHDCALLALQDPFVSQPGEISSRQGRGEVRCLRIPAAFAWGPRLEIAGQFRDHFRPDWISFHLVPYSFQKRGLLQGLSQNFRELVRDYSLHLMFHELWLGAGRPSPLRFYVTGFLQRRGIGTLLSRIRPRRITTSNPVYAAMLRRFRIEAEVLPLFGNIPISETGLDLALHQFLGELEITDAVRPRWWIGVFFGSLHAEWKPEPFLSLLIRAAQRGEKRVCLILIGRPGSEGKAIWEKLQAEYGPQILFLNRGEQSTESISTLLQLADFGIAASPWQLIGKSGTVAAMLDHGLPVIVTRDDFQPFVRGDGPPSSDPLVHRCDDALEAKLVAGLAKRSARAGVNDVAAQLVHLLQTAP
jgi:glycosyltransferase involved in cell wall biosynthesis